MGKRRTAEERREEVIRAAIDEFAIFGFHGGSTERIAVAAGISQPYVLRLFGTKKALFLAAIEQICDDILAEWRRAIEAFDRSPEAPGTPEQRLEVIGETYHRFVRDEVQLRLVLQGCAAAENAEIREQMQRGMIRLFDWAKEASGADYDAVQTFYATGMMLTVAASLRAAELVPDIEWARAMLLVQPS